MRRTHILRAGLVGVVGAVGCNRQAVLPNGQPATPFTTTSNSKFDPTAIPQQPAAPAVAAREPARKSAAPLRPDTEVLVADNAVDDAFAEIFDQSGFATAVTTDGTKPAAVGTANWEVAKTRADDGLRPKYSPVERDRLVDTARQRYQRALATDPAHKGALVGLARLYTFTGDKDRAVQAYTAAVKAHPQDHGLACRLAGVQVQFGDFPGAEQSARYALSLDPQNRTYQKALGLALGHQAKWQEAGEVLLAAGMPEADAHYFLARVRLDRGDADGGRKQLQLALTANPQHPAATQIAAQLDAGRPAPALSPANPVMAAGYTDGPR